MAGVGAAYRGTSGDRRGSLTPPRLGIGSCAGSAMATLLAPASASVHGHIARRLHFSASSDGLL
jgi:hypothetical protein